MRKQVVPLAVAGVLLSGGGLQAEDASTTVLNLYKESVENPDKLDESIVLLEALDSEGVLPCVVSIRDRHWQLARATIEQCSRQPDEWACLSNDPSASLALWAHGMVRVLEEDVGSWTETFSGGNLVRAKRRAEQQAPNTWNLWVGQAALMVRGMITCP